MDWAGFRAMCRAKVDGTLVLDELTGQFELDFFVMFSSASAVWGSALAGHYAAANCFEDAMAHDRAGRGLPGLAVDWGWWSGSELVDAAHLHQFEAIGLDVLPDEVGFAALDRLLGSARTQLTVAPVDWARFRPVLEARRRRPLLDLMGARRADSLSAVDTVLLDRLRDGSNSIRVRLLEERLQREVAAVLGRSADMPALERDSGFFEAGMDSIMSVELKNRIEEILDVDLHATAAFENPNIAALAGYLLGEVLALPVNGARDDSDLSVGQNALPDDLVAQLDDLSEEELLRLLGDELEREQR
jgi:acyl carrier protein